MTINNKASLIKLETLISESNPRFTKNLRSSCNQIHKQKTLTTILVIVVCLSSYLDDLWSLLGGWANK